MKSRRAHLTADLEPHSASSFISSKCDNVISICLTFLPPFALKLNVKSERVIYLPSNSSKFLFPNHFVMSFGAVNCSYHCGISLHLESQALLLQLLAPALPGNSPGPCWTASIKAFGAGPITAADWCGRCCCFRHFVSVCYYPFHCCHHRDLGACCDQHQEGKVHAAC